MPPIGTLGSTLTSGSEGLKVKYQTFPHNGSTRLERPTTVSPPATDNNHWAGAKAAPGGGR